MVKKMLEASNLTDDVFNEQELRRLFSQQAGANSTAVQQAEKEKSNPHATMEVIVQQSKDQYFWDLQPEAYG